MFSYLTFSWVAGLMSVAAKGPLSEVDIWAQPARDECSVMANVFQSTLQDLIKSGRSLPMWRAVLRTAGGEFIVGGLSRVWWLAAVVAQVIFLRKVLEYVVQGGSVGEGIGWAIGVGGCSLVQTLSQSMFFFSSARGGLRVLGALNVCVFRKSMLLSVSATQQSGTSAVATATPSASGGASTGPTSKRWLCCSRGPPKPVVVQSSAGVSPVNLAQNDSRRVFEGLQYFHFAWSSFLEIGAVVLFLVLEIGVSGFAAIAAVATLIPAQVLFVKLISNRQRRAIAKTDQRTKTMGELLRGALLVKLNAWEERFLAKVSGLRAEEIALLRSAEIMNAGNIAIFQSAPLLAAVAMFAVYTLALGHTLESAVAFPALAWVNILMRTLIVLPRSFGAIIEANVSLGRLERYLALEEKPQALVRHPGPGPKDEGREPVTTQPLHIVAAAGECNPGTAASLADVDVSVPLAAVVSPPGAPSASDDVAVCISRCSFTWATGFGPGDSPPVVLRDVQLTVRRSILLAVAGPIAAGKSSLVAALLGELETVPPMPRPKAAMSGATVPVAQDAGAGLQVTAPVSVWGKVALVPQKPWITNASIQANILFGREFDLERFSEVVTACCLDVDLASFPDGPHTEVGEGGTSLSGGQQQRVCMARAVYGEADIYIFDDPLSALDAAVANQVFERVLSSRGILGSKTRILVTHTLWCLPHTDEIVMLDAGRVRHQGTFQQLVDAGVDFSSSLDTGVAEGASPDAAAAAVASAAAVGTGALASPAGAVSPVDSDKGDENPVVKKARPAAAQLGAPSARVLVQAESRAQGSVSGSTYSAYIRAAGGWSMFFFVLALFGVAQACRVVTDWWVARWCSGAFGLPDGASTLIYLGAVMAFTLLVFARTIAFTMAMLRAGSNLHNAMFSKVLHAQMGFFWSNPSGRILNRFTKDVDNLDKYMIRAAVDWFSFTTIAIGAVISIMVILPWLLVLEVPLLVVMTLLTNHFLRSSRQLRRLEGTTRSPMFQHFGDTVQGLMVVRAFQDEPRHLHRYVALVNKNVSTFMVFLGASRWLSVRLDSTSSLLLLGCALLGVLLRSSISAGILGVALTQGLQLSGLLQFAIRQGAETESYMTSAERVAEYGTLATEVTPEPEVRPPSGWPSEGDITFNNVSFKYAADLPLALSDVSLRTGPRAKVGIVGRSGCGKSTLGSALFRICELDSGTVTLDGVDCGHVPLDTLRSRIAVIPQTPTLFSGTLRSNLDPFSSHDDAVLWQALDRVHLREAVAALPSGLGAFCAENGDNFSVGQRQLLCLARALVRNANVIFVDEATSNVDVDTDAIVQATIRSEFQHCTVMTVAHRLNTVIDYDLIVVMGAGRVVEVGSPAELLARPGSAFGAMVDETGQAASVLRAAAVKHVGVEGSTSQTA